jgi:hypothetical protein
MLDKTLHRSVYISSNEMHSASEEKIGSVSSVRSKSGLMTNIIRGNALHLTAPHRGSTTNIRRHPLTLGVLYISSNRLRLVGLYFPIIVVCLPNFIIRINDKYHKYKNCIFSPVLIFDIMVMTLSLQLTILQERNRKAVHALNSTASQFASHSSTIEASGLPVAAAFGFMPGLIGLRNG